MLAVVGVMVCVYVVALAVQYVHVRVARRLWPPAPGEITSVQVIGDLGPSYVVMEGEITGDRIVPNQAVSCFHPRTGRRVRCRVTSWSQDIQAPYEQKVVLADRGDAPDSSTLVMPPIVTRYTAVEDRQVRREMSVTEGRRARRLRVRDR